MGCPSGRIIVLHSYFIIYFNKILINNSNSFSLALISILYAKGLMILGANGWPGEIFLFVGYIIKNEFYLWLYNIDYSKLRRI